MTSRHGRTGETSVATGDRAPATVATILRVAGAAVIGTLPALVLMSHYDVNVELALRILAVLAVAGAVVIRRPRPGVVAATAAAILGATLLAALTGPAPWAAQLAVVNAVATVGGAAAAAVVTRVVPTTTARSRLATGATGALAVVGTVAAVAMGAASASGTVVQAVTGAAGLALLVAAVPPVRAVVVATAVRVEMAAVTTARRRRDGLRRWTRPDTAPDTATVAWPLAFVERFVPFPVACWLAAGTVAAYQGFGSAPWVTDGRIVGDAGYYVSIAQNGYRPDTGSEALFPLYPAILRVVHAFGVRFEVAAPAVSAVAGLAALLGVWEWTRRHGVEPVPRRIAVALLAFAPCGAFLAGIAYPDSVVLALVVWALVLAESGRLLPATLLGAAATATEPIAVALVPALIVLALTTDGALAATGPWTWDRSKVRARAALPLLALGGALSHVVWCWVRRDDPFAFWQSQVNVFGRLPVTWATSWLRFTGLAHPTMVTHRGALAVADEVVSAVAVVAAVAALPALARRHGAHLAVLVAGAVVAAWTMGSPLFAPAARLLLVAFPVAVVAGEWLAPRRRWWPVVGALVVVASVVLTRGFADGSCCR